MSLTSFSNLLSGLADVSRGAGLEAPEDWRQGRTAYGGLTAALCLAASQQTIPDLPPLRSAQFAFIGPAAGPLTMATTLLRRGKSSAFVRVELHGEAGLATEALLCFGADRASALDYGRRPSPSVGGQPEDYPAYFAAQTRPTFSQHFDARLVSGARPITPGAEPEMLVWLRHRDPLAGEGLAAVVALADALPAAAMVLFPERAAISTMTWSIDILATTPRSHDGWWLAHSRAETARDGYSAQTMGLWGRDGQPVLAARQTVAIFA